MSVSAPLPRHENYVIAARSGRHREPGSAASLVEAALRDFQPRLLLPTGEGTTPAHSPALDPLGVIHAAYLFGFAPDLVGGHISHAGVLARSEAVSWLHA